MISFICVGLLPGLLSHRLVGFWVMTFCIYCVPIVGLYFLLRRYLFTQRQRRHHYRKMWGRFCLIHGLGTLYDKRIVAPKLVRIRSESWADWLYVRMLPGQLPEQYERVREAMAHSLGVERVLTWSDSPGRVVLRVQIRRPEPVYDWVSGTEARVSYR